MAYKITPEQRRQMLEKARKDAIKEAEKKFREEMRKKEEEEKKRRVYPPTIATMVKRIKRIDPWKGVCALDSYDASVVVYYRLYQKGWDDIRIGVNNRHCWVEFKFDDKWYIFDVAAVKSSKYGEPIKDKTDAENDVYKQLTRYYSNIDTFMEKFDDKIELSKHEAMKMAQEDDGLNTVLVMKYH